MSSLKSLLLLATVGCFYAKNGDVAACLKEKVDKCMQESHVKQINKDPTGRYGSPV